MNAMEISRTALDVEWRRLEIIADNLANAGTAGTTWTPHRLVSGPRASFESHLNRDPQSIPLAGVEIRAVEPVLSPPRLVHEPGNPAADARGYVAYPGVGQAQEMTLMVRTARIYEANIVAMNSARQMYQKGLELGLRR